MAIFIALAFPMDADAAKKRKRKKKRAPRVAKKAEVTVPVNVGVAPTLFMFYGPVMEDQTFHTGLRFDVFAIINQATIKQARHKIPRKYRKLALNAAKGEGIRFRPAWYIPKNIVFSPKVNNTGVFGVNFAPFAFRLALSQSPRLSVSSNLLLTYNYVYSDTLPSPTHFLRPGLEIGADLELPMSKDFRLSIGYTSAFYPPQEIGGEVFKWGDPAESIWHVGQLYLMFHFRFPYTTRI